VLPFFLSLSFSNPFSNLPSLVSRVLACSWVCRERSVLQMRGCVRGVGFSWGSSHFVLTCGSHFHKWQTIHFPLTTDVLWFIGWSDRMESLVNLSSLLSWSSSYVSVCWWPRYHTWVYSLRLS
jgi:hypothetical protein